MDCGLKATDLDQPGKYRLGPYGYARGKALSLIRAFRDTIQFPAYLGSQLQDKTQIQQRSDPNTLVLKQGDVVLIDSDLCFDWPFDGCFVGITFAKGPVRFDIKRDYPVLDVAPFHATLPIRRIESQNIG